MYQNPSQPQAMQERYKELPPHIMELFEYGTVDFVIDSLAKEYGLSEEQKIGLRMEIELVLYLFLPRKGFVERLKESLQTEHIRTEQIAARVEDDLFTIVDDILTFVESQFNDEGEVAMNPVILAPAASPETTPPALEPVTEQSQQPEKVEPGVKSLRTFAKDVEISRAHSYGAFKSNDDGNPDDENVHTTSQDDILKK